MAVLTDLHLVDEDDLERWSDPDHQPGADVAVPELTPTDGGVELTLAWERRVPELR